MTRSHPARSLELKSYRRYFRTTSKFVPLDTLSPAHRRGVAFILNHSGLRKGLIDRIALVIMDPFLKSEHHDLRALAEVERSKAFVRRVILSLRSLPHLLEKVKARTMKSDAPSKERSFELDEEVRKAFRRVESRLRTLGRLRDQDLGTIAATLDWKPYQKPQRLHALRSGFNFNRIVLKLEDVLGVAAHPKLIASIMSQFGFPAKVPNIIRASRRRPKTAARRK